MISVIIPACNEEKYILNTLNSIHSCCEIIVVCNGCTDNTYSLVKGKYKTLNFKWGNVSRARNEGAKVAKGDILVFLDADTCLSENFVNLISSLKGSYVGTCKVKPSFRKLKHKVLFSLKNKFVTPFGGSNGILFCLAKDFNSFDESLCKREDRVFIRSLRKSCKFVVLNDYVVTSTRRFDAKGYFKMALYWGREVLKPSKDEYEVVR